jgi:hypothetical protein
MSWKVQGNVLISCNCEWGCPCNFNARPSHGHCEGGWLWSIDKGQLDNVDVSGLCVALYADWPGAIHEGGGVAVSYIDERANEKQREALTGLVRGEIGGPWKLFSGTYTLKGPEPARFDLQLSSYDTKFKIGDAVELELKLMTNPVTGADLHPEVVLPEGLVLKRGHLAASKVFRVRDDINYDHSGKYAAFGAFEYST